MFDPWHQSKINAGIDKIKAHRVAQPDIESIDDLKRLAGVSSSTVNSAPVISNADKAKYARENNIRPGDAAWFKLNFARPDLTGESPFSKNR